MMHQIIPSLPDEVPVRHVTSHDGRVRYLGSAKLMPNGRYLALAIIDGQALARMEMELSFPQLARRNITW